MPPGVGPVEKFADVSGTPQGQFLEGGAFDTQGNLWFVAIGSGWVSYRHGRNAGYPTPPVQSRTCSFPASGSSVALASAQGSTVISSRPCLLWPAGRLAHAAPVRHVRDEFPFRAACFRRDLPHVMGFPHLRVLCSIRLPSRIRWAFPVTVLLHLPGRVPRRCAGASIVPCPGFPFRASGAVDHTPSFSTGRSVWGLPSSSTPLFLHATA